MSFWQDKRVLVTGADGFLGSNLVKSLLSQKASIITFTRAGIGPRSLLRLEGLVDHITQIEVGSVEDFARLNALINDSKIEIIYHLAALPLVEIGQVNPIKTFEVNVAGTWNILEAARQSQVAKIIVVSTVHVYGNNPKLPFKEAFYPQPSRPYETSKAVADLIAQCYADSYDLNVEIPRFVNLYGPGDLNFSRLVPKVMKMVLANQNPVLWENGAIRDFLYIDDAVAALELLAEKKSDHTQQNRIYNFGSGRPIDVFKLAERIVSLGGRPHMHVKSQPIPTDRMTEILKQYVSIAKAKSVLGWRPRVTLTAGLRRTLDWYEKYQAYFL